MTLRMLHETSHSTRTASPDETRTDASGTDPSIHRLPAGPVPNGPVPTRKAGVKDHARRFKEWVLSWR